MLEFIVSVEPITEDDIREAMVNLLKDGKDTIPYTTEGVTYVKDKLMEILKPKVTVRIKS